MGQQGASDSDNENADVESEEVSVEEEVEEEFEEEPNEEESSEVEPNEEEQCEEESDEEEPCEEDPNEGEVPCEDDSDEEEEPCEDVPIEEKDPCEDDPIKEEELNDEGDPDEEPDEEVSEEDPLDVDSDDGEEHQLKATPSNSDKKRAVDRSEASVQKRQKQELNSKLEELNDEGEPNEEPDEEVSEEDPLEADSDDGEEHQLKATPSNSDKKRAVDRSEASVQKRQNQELNSKLESRVLSPGTDIQDMPKNLPRNDIVSDKQKSIVSSGNKRRSRWDTDPGADDKAVDGGGTATKKRKSRWASDDTQLNMLDPLRLPDFVKGLVPETDLDPEIRKLNAQLRDITQKLLARELCDDQPENERSPSPPPIYNELGIRINTREARLRAKLVDQRKNILSDLIQRNPNFKPPSDLIRGNPTVKPPSDRKPPNFYKKLYIPVREYPGYNFVGLIIGPRGLTQKRMEKETGARILLRGKGSVIRGKGSVKEEMVGDSSTNEDLHVCIEADTQNSLDAAVAMVEKLLVPVEEGKNALKRAQLRELAELQGTCRVENTHSFQRMTPETNVPCKVCGNASHLTAACPLTASTPGTGISGHQVGSLTKLGSGLFSPFSGPPVPTSETNVPCEVCGSASHLTASCPLTASIPGTGISGHQVGSLTKLGNGLFSSFSSPPVPGSTIPLMANPPVGALSSYNGKSAKEVDEAKLYVGYLPQSVDDNKLIEMFLPFGQICEAKVIRDKITGLSKGYGFIKYVESVFAADAVARMNGYKIEGKMLAVRVAGLPPSTSNNNTGLVVPQSFAHLPTYPGPAVIPQGNPGPMNWPGPPGSMLPDSYASFPKSSGLLSQKSPASFGSSSQTPASYSLIAGSITPSKELAQFPGYLNSFDTQDIHYQMTASNPLLPTQVRLTQSLGSHQAPVIPRKPPL